MTASLDAQRDALIESSRAISRDARALIAAAQADASSACVGAADILNAEMWRKKLADVTSIGQQVIAAIERSRMPVRQHEIDALRNFSRAIGVAPPEWLSDAEAEMETERLIDEARWEAKRSLPRRIASAATIESAAMSYVGMESHGRATGIKRKGKRR